MKLKIACLHCGAKVKPRERRCLKCGKALVRVLDGRFKQSRCMSVDGVRLALAGIDQTTRREVFIRVLLPEASAAEQEALTMEARLLQLFDGHAGFPAFIHGGRLHDTGGLYLVEGFVHGSSLAAIQDRYAPSELIELYALAMEPVKLLHAHGVVHCALAPKHFIASRDGRFILIDFRQARPAGAVSGGTGIPRYQAPEQLQPHQPVTEATDVFALGACIYKAVTHRLPFSRNRVAPNPGKGPRPPSKRSPKITADLDPVLLQALERTPGHRFPSAAALQAAIADALGATTETDALVCPFRPAWLECLALLGRGLGQVCQYTRAASCAMGKTVMDAGKWCFGTLLRPHPAAGVAVVTLCLVLGWMAALQFPGLELPVEGGTTARSAAPADHPNESAGLSDGSSPDSWNEGHTVRPLVLEPLVPETATVAFHTWPPSSVYIDGAFVLEAPSPYGVELAEGEHTVTIVSNRGDWKSFTFNIVTGRSYVFKLNFETGYVSFQRNESWRGH